MALRFVPCFFFLFPLMAFYFAHGEDELLSNCTKGFFCGSMGYLEFPFASHTQPHCGLVAVDCDAKPFPKVQLGMKGESYQLVMVRKIWDAMYQIHMIDSRLRALLDGRSCSVVDYKPLFLKNSPSITFHVLTADFLKCNHSPDDQLCTYEWYNNCTEGSSLYYERPWTGEGHGCVPAGCIHLEIPILIEQPNAANVGLDLEVSKDCYECYYGGGKCTTDGNNELQCKNGNSTAGNSKRKLILISVGAVGAIFMIILLLCITKKLSFRSCIDPMTDKRNYQDVEEFLKSHGPLAPKRFSYSEVKKITDSFKNELGQGGFGSVYKGKLRNGTLVAVKVLKELKASGEEFINEVASISRTSHVNIVTLIGFCFEGNKRALVYEFMPNGSLEKFIYDNKSLAARQLGWNTLYKISIGIARGLEYLHRGCNTRILHLDIKPHNILLNEDFSPKISDFGLAKLCIKEESIVSIFGPRGTIGYIAPEVVCKNIGRVSHKSDVYSYGMMVLEMVGGRKNVDSGVSRNSKIYFPHWIYARLELGDELGLVGVMNEEENECARKMVIVSLWCIQTDPSTRPSMSRVVEMLEGKLEYLQIPPKPYLYSPTRSE